MNAAIVILRDALRMFFGNILNTAFLFLPLIVFVTLTIISVLIVNQSEQLNLQQHPTIFATGLIALFIAGWIALSWSAIAFHRHHIIGENFLGWIPKISKSILWSYIRLEVKIILILIPLFILLALISTMFGGGNVRINLYGFNSASKFEVVISLLVGWILQMLYPSLAGRAIGNHVGISDAWGTTRKFRLTFFFLALIFSATQFLISMAQYKFDIGIISNLVDLIFLGLGVAIVTSSYKFIKQGNVA